MKFIDTAVDTEHRFSIGVETESGECFLAIPVSNTLCDYEEWYRIDRATHDAYPENLEELIQFSRACRNREHDDLLFLPPGPDRGV